MSEEIPTQTTAAGRLMDEMLAAQTRFAQAWHDGVELTTQQRADEASRDRARIALLAMMANISTLDITKIAASTHLDLQTVGRVLSALQVLRGGEGFAK